MKKNILTVIAFVLLLIFSYLGYKYYTFTSALKNFGKSFSEQLTSLPAVKMEAFAPDSSQKIGVYRFLVAGNDAYKATDYEVSLINSDMEYPKTGNILSGEVAQPIAKWLSADSVLVQSNTTSLVGTRTTMQLNGIVIVIEK